MSDIIDISSEAVERAAWRCENAALPGSAQMLRDLAKDRDRLATRARRVEELEEVLRDAESGQAGGEGEADADDVYQFLKAQLREAIGRPVMEINKAEFLKP